MAPTEPERFWDERARENAFFYVDDQVDYGDPDTEAFWRRGDETLEKILSPLEQTVSPQDTVVDIGCGVGRMTRALASRAARVIALDVSQEMLARARELNAQVQNVEWIHGDGRTLAPIADGSVDGCFSHVVFQHLPDPEMTLGYVREMGRVLHSRRPSGSLCSSRSATRREHDERAHPRRGRAGARPRGTREHGSCRAHG